MEVTSQDASKLTVPSAGVASSSPTPAPSPNMLPSKQMSPLLDSVKVNESSKAQLSQAVAEMEHFALPSTSVDLKADINETKVATIQTNSSASVPVNHETNPNDKQTLADKMVNESEEKGPDGQPKISNRKYKEMMKKMKRDPRLQSLVNMMGGPNSDVKLIPKMQKTTSQRLREKLNKKEPKKTEDEKKADVQNHVKDTVTASVDKMKETVKAQNEKMKKLQKKYGKVTLERYSEALKHLSEAKKLPSDLQHERNLTDLYLKQNPPVEAQIEKLDDDTDMNESVMEDLEKPQVEPKVNEKTAEKKLDETNTDAKVTETKETEAETKPAKSEEDKFKKALAQKKPIHRGPARRFLQHRGLAKPVQVASKSDK